MKKFLYVFSAVSLLLTSCIDDASSTAFMELPNVSIAMDDAVHFDLGVEGEYAPTIDWAELLLPITIIYGQSTGRRRFPVIRFSNTPLQNPERYI